MNEFQQGGRKQPCHRRGLIHHHQRNEPKTVWLGYLQKWQFNFQGVFLIPAHRSQLHTAAFSEQVVQPRKGFAVYRHQSERRRVGIVTGGQEGLPVGLMGRRKQNDARELPAQKRFEGMRGCQPGVNIAGMRRNQPH